MNPFRTLFKKKDPPRISYLEYEFCKNGAGRYMAGWVVSFAILAVLTYVSMRAYLLGETADLAFMAPAACVAFFNIVLWSRMTKYRNTMQLYFEQESRDESKI